MRPLPAASTGRYAGTTVVLRSRWWTSCSARTTPGSWSLSGRAAQSHCIDRVMGSTAGGNEGGLATHDVGSLIEGVRNDGFVDGRTIAFEHRLPDEKPELFTAMAAQLVSLKPDVLVGVGSAAV